MLLHCGWKALPAGALGVCMCMCVCARASVRRLRLCLCLCACLCQRRLMRVACDCKHCACVWLVCVCVCDARVSLARARSLFLSLSQSSSLNLSRRQSLPLSVYFFLTPHSCICFISRARALFNRWINSVFSDDFPRQPQGRSVYYGGRAGRGNYYDDERPYPSSPSAWAPPRDWRENRAWSEGRGEARGEGGSWGPPRERQRQESPGDAREGIGSVGVGGMRRGGTGGFRFTQDEAASLRFRSGYGQPSAAPPASASFSSTPPFATPPASASMFADTSKNASSDGGADGKDAKGDEGTGNLLSFSFRVWGALDRESFAAAGEASRGFISSSCGHGARRLGLSW